MKRSQKDELKLMSKNDVVSRSKDILGGVPVFSGTRVPVQTLVDYLEAGDRIDDFLEDFPSVTREQAKKYLDRAAEALLAEQKDSSV